MILEELPMLLEQLLTKSIHFTFHWFIIYGLSLNLIKIEPISVFCHLLLGSFFVLGFNNFNITSKEYNLCTFYIKSPSISLLLLVYMIYRINSFLLFDLFSDHRVIFIDFFINLGPQHPAILPLFGAPSIYLLFFPFIIRCIWIND